MAIAVEKLPKSRVKIRVELAPNEIQADLEKAAERMSAAAKFPGFRPGKVPYQLVQQRFGEQAILEAALETIVQRSFVAAVREHNLRTVGQPEIQVEKLAPGNPLVFTATSALVPEVVLPPYDAVKARRKHVVITDEDVEKGLTELRNVLAKETQVERPAQLGDKVELDVDVFVDKVAIEGGQSRSHPAILGQGNFIPGFEEQIVGMAKGQVKNFTLNFPKEYHSKTLAGRPAEFKVKLTAVLERILPAADDLLAQRAAKLPTLLELKARLRQDLATERQKRGEQELEIALLDGLVERTKFEELPEILVENEVGRMLEELKHDAQHRGMKFEDMLATMKKTELQLKQELHPNAERRVKTALVIRRISEIEKIGADDKEIADEIERARQNVPPEQRTAEHFGSEDFRDYIRTVLINRKAIAILKSKASISE